MKKNIVRMAAVLLMLILACSSYAYAKSYKYGALNLSCDLIGNKSKKKASATAYTNGAPDDYKNYVAVYIRTDSGLALNSGSTIASTKASKSITFKDKKNKVAKKADSYHAACDKNGNMLEKATKQIRLNYTY